MGTKAIRGGRHLPTGAVTVMFTDVEGSTRLLAALGERYVVTLADHRRILREAAIAAGGVEVDNQGDAFFFAFPSPDSGLAAAVAMQIGLAEHDWPGGAPLQVRIGIHTGRPTRTDDGYIGLDLHRGARISSAGHGGQVVLSSATHDEARAAPDGARFRSLGAHRLKDLDQPLTLFDLVIDGLPADFPPLRSIGSRPTNLPRGEADLVGRDADIEAGVSALSGADRLLTFTGPGGTGKTSLAAYVATLLLPRCPDGAFVVWLASVQNTQFVAAAVASALGLRERAGRGVKEVLLDYLADREMLLVLDNFEHVVDAAALVTEMLQAAPRLRVLVTSRILLRVPGEVEMRVEPLALETSAGGLSSAVELFLARARKVRPTLPSDEATLAAIHEICVGLDGLPLAIELAAARVRLMTPQGMLARLAQPLELAAGGSRNTDRRHRALRATIDYSVDLLDERLRSVFVTLGIFAGHFTVAAAEGVCDATLDELAELLDHSLLRSFDDADGETRLGMLETVRAYARERLATRPDADVIHDRHAQWCAELAGAGGPRLLEGAHEKVLARFDAELDDLRQALDWLGGSGQSVAALRMANNLGVFWDTRDQLTEGRARLEATLGAAVDASDRDRAVAMFYIGRMAALQGDGPGAQQVLEAALRIFTTAGDARDVTLCLSHLGLAQLSRPEGLSEARRWNEEALAVARADGDPWSVAVALNNLATLQERTDPEYKAELLTESLRIRRTLGEKRTLAITLHNVGELAVERGAYDEAREALDEALALAIDIGLEMVVTGVLLDLGVVAQHEGDLDTAFSLLESAHTRAERSAAPEPLVRSLRGLAQVAQIRGDEDAARRHLAAADEVAWFF